MDITQETITLLRLRLESIRRQVGPVRRYRAGRNCQKGYNCGGSCITRRKNCRKALEGEAKNFSEWMVQKMTAQIPAVLGDAPEDKPKAEPQRYEKRADVSTELQARVDRRISKTYDREAERLKNRLTMEEVQSLDPDLLPPGIKTYMEAKQAAKEGDIVLVKKGDFYRTYFDDAVKTVEVTGLRDTVSTPLDQKDNWGPIVPLTGIPLHALDRMGGDIVNSGYSLTIVDAD